MLETSEEYKEKIQNYDRNIKPKVEFYFDGEEEDPIVFASDDISDIDILEEIQTEGSTPLGTIASNELIITLKNEDNRFLAANIESPFYGKIRQSIKVIPYYGIKLADGGFEYIKMGEYYVTEWEADSGSPNSMVICNDKLFKVGEMDIPLIPTAENITARQMFITLFKALGLSSEEYDVDVVLSQIQILIAYFPDGKAREGLAKMAEAFNCNVTVTRNGVIKVSSNESIADEPIVEYTDEKMIFTTNMPQKFSNVFSKINVATNQHIIKDTQSGLSAKYVPVSATGRKLDNLKFGASPSAYVEYIKIEKSTHLEVKSINIGTWGVNLELENLVGTEKQTDVEIFTHPMDIAKDEVEITNEGAYNLIGDKKYPINNYLIQKREDALSHAEKVAPLVTDPAGYVKITTRGDPSMELNDVVKATDNANKLGSLNIVPIRHQLRYDSGLGCEILAIKKTARKPDE